jgi:hypothetical protein
MIDARGSTWLRRILTSSVLALGLMSAPGSGQSPSGVIAIDGRDWSLTMSAAALPWAEANEFCATLETGGHTDWRLPTLFELEQLHDPAAASSIRGSFELEDCCAWSSQNLVAIAAEQKGDLPPQSGPPETYYWGFLFDGGISYYSNGRFADGFAMCTRGPVSEP